MYTTFSWLLRCDFLKGQKKVKWRKSCCIVYPNYRSEKNKEKGKYEFTHADDLVGSDWAQNENWILLSLVVKFSWKNIHKEMKTWEKEKWEAVNLFEYYVVCGTNLVKQNKREVRKRKVQESWVEKHLGNKKYGKGKSFIWYSILPFFSYYLYCFPFSNCRRF